MSTSAQLKPSKDKQERQAKQRKMLSDAVSGLKTIAGIAQDVTKVVDPGLPGLQPVLTGLIYQLSMPFRLAIIFTLTHHLTFGKDNFEKYIEYRTTIGENPAIGGES